PAVATYQAYNTYPDDCPSSINCPTDTGKSLYAYNSHGANTVTGKPSAAKVSWNRPYAGRGAGQLLDWEVYFVRWLEQSGYDVKYSTDVDTHENSARLLNSKAFLSTGHNEYWSKPMYDGVQQARDAGVHLGFFGADAVYWQVRFEASPLTGAADRVVVGYKNQSIDPVQGPTTTVLWRDPFLNRPEQRLVGVRRGDDQLELGTGPRRRRGPAHPAHHGESAQSVPGCFFRVRHVPHGDDQPGSGSGRSHEQLADQLHRGLQRAGERLQRRRRHDQRQRGRHQDGGGERRSEHLQRGSERHEHGRHGDRQHPLRGRAG